ncbi:hypothetical protein SLS62_010100 [Diatrype stigma]|uniref:MARVEL domain-containing protein n=1 Tax=Diatrype stigma TaxID=117547 RepID=A0AAN9UJW8_9PEZI
MGRLLRFPSSAAGGSMESGLLVGLRAAQLVSALIVMSLMAYVADWYNAATLTMAPPQINWLLACSVISIFSLGYLEGAKRFFPRAFHSTAALALEAVNALFFFSGFVYLAVFIGKLLFCRGSVCGAARASAVFGALAFLLWCASAALAARTVAQVGAGVSLPRFRMPGRGKPAPVEKDVAMEEGAGAGSRA